MKNEPMPYTGNKDPKSGARPGTTKFGQLMVKRYGFKNLGIWANRPMRGTTNLSVHATGRAIDLGYAPDQKALAAEVALWLVDHYRELGIEELHDYAGITRKGAEKWGRGFRCNRNGVAGFKEWTATANGGTPGGQWLHVELSPQMADNPDQFVAAWKSITPKPGKPETE